MAVGFYLKVGDLVGPGDGLNSYKVLGARDYCSKRLRHCRKRRDLLERNVVPTQLHLQ